MNKQIGPDVVFRTDFLCGRECKIEEEKKRLLQIAFSYLILYVTFCMWWTNNSHCILLKGKQLPFLSAHKQHNTDNG